jgi:hypothetical protein
MGYFTVAKEEFEAYFKFIKKLKSIFLKYAEETGIKQAQQYSFHEIDRDNLDIEFRWHETWSPGGEEMHICYMPAIYTLDYPKWKTKFLAEKIIEAEKKIRQKAKAKAEREEQERAQLKILQARYPEG